MTPSADRASTESIERPRVGLLLLRALALRASGKAAACRR